MSAFAKDPWGKRAVSARPESPTQDGGPPAPATSTLRVAGAVFDLDVLMFEGLRTGRATRRVGQPAPLAALPASPETVVITASAALVLKLICEARRIDPQEAVLRALVTYAETAIGLPGLLGDEENCVGRAVVARRLPAAHHKPEVAGSMRVEPTVSARASHPAATNRDSNSASVPAREDGPPAVLPLPDGDLTDVPDVPRGGPNRFADAARAPP